MSRESNATLTMETDVEKKHTHTRRMRSSQVLVYIQSLFSRWKCSVNEDYKEVTIILPHKGSSVMAQFDWCIPTSI